MQYRVIRDLGNSDYVVGSVFDGAAFPPDRLQRLVGQRLIEPLGGGPDTAPGIAAIEALEREVTTLRAQVALLSNPDPTFTGVLTSLGLPGIEEVVARLAAVEAALDLTPPEGNLTVAQQEGVGSDAQSSATPLAPPDALTGAVLTRLAPDDPLTGAVVAAEPEGLRGLKVADLRGLATASGIAGAASLTRPALIAALVAAGVTGPPEGGDDAQ